MDQPTPPTEPSNGEVNDRSGASAQRPFGWMYVATAGLILVVVAGANSFIDARNELVDLDTQAETQWSQVENQLLRQYELLPKLVAVTNRYAEHEKAILGKLVQARERYLEASPRERPELAGDIDGAMLGVLAIVEQYPDLKADRQYRDLAYEIAGTKNRIAVERGRYNESIGVLNTRLRQVPWMFVAMEIEPRIFLEVEQSNLAEPQLDI